MSIHSAIHICPACAHPLPKAAARCFACDAFLADYRALAGSADLSSRRLCRECSAELPRAAVRCFSCGREAPVDAPAGPAAPPSAADALPRLHVTTEDHQRLESLGRVQLALGHPVARFLLQELERATLCMPEQIANDVVTLGSRVLFRLDPGGTTAVRELVAPHRHRAEARQVSVMSPLGAALLGLSEGDGMPYLNLEGAARRVTIETVAGQPEATALPAS